MVREVCSSSLGLRINRCLKMLPPAQASEVEELLRPLGIKCTVVHAQTKTSRAFRQQVDQFEWWAEGYHAGTGVNVAIVSGTFAVALPDRQERRLVAWVVRDVETFLKDLKDVCTVASVQQS